MFPAFGAVFFVGVGWLGSFYSFAGKLFYRGGYTSLNLVKSILEYEEVIQAHLIELKLNPTINLMELSFGSKIRMIEKKYNFLRFQKGWLSRNIYTG